MLGPAKSFLGEIFRAESFNRFDFIVNDSQSYVISDYYIEQTWPIWAARYSASACGSWAGADAVDSGALRIKTPK